MVMNKLLLIGNGQFGQKYFQTLNGFLNVSLTVASHHNWKSLIDQKPDGVLIVTPPNSHIEIAFYALDRGIPCMIEKPLALSLEEAEPLSWYSAPILVNHIHLFARDYQAIKRNIKPNKIKNIQTIGTSNRAPREYSELWDYGPHDIAMILDLTQQFPQVIKCQQQDRQFIINMQFDDCETTSIIGHSDSKRRVISVNNGMFVYDQEVATDLPLNTALDVFLGAINGVPDYRMGLDLALNVMRVLEACQKSLLN
jgi:predicted dehydrogenase